MKTTDENYIKTGRIACKKCSGDGCEECKQAGYFSLNDSVCAICGGTGIIKGGLTDSRADEKCPCQIPSR